MTCSLHLSLCCIGLCTLVNWCTLVTVEPPDWTPWPCNECCGVSCLHIVPALQNADKPGYSWRVGVHPPVDEASQHSASAVAKAILAKNTKPALMQIELKV